MIDCQLFSSYIKLLRINKNLSQVQLAKEAKVSSTTIWRIEENKQYITIELLIPICEILEVNIGDLLFLCKLGETVTGEMSIKNKLMHHYKLDYAMKFDKSTINWKSLREEIKKSRIEKGWTQKKFGEFLGLSATAASRTESDGKRAMQLLALKKVCKVLDIDMDELLKEHTIKRSL